MRIVVLSLLITVSLTTAFTPAIRTASKTKSATQLDLHRRDFLITALGGLLVAPATANAAGSTFFYDDKIEQVREASQMPTDGKVDLNSAFVDTYKAFPGMFPTAAGKIASHGPYNSVADIYKIKDLTQNDIKLFRKYEKYFTTKYPGRAFDERINSRVST